MKNRLLYATMMLVALTGLVVSQNIPELNGKIVTITREVNGNLTIMHFIEKSTGKEIYIKNTTTPDAERLKKIAKTSYDENSAKNRNYIIIKYAIMSIVALIFIIIILWNLGKDKTESKKNESPPNENPPNESPPNESPPTNDVSTDSTGADQLGKRTG